MACRDAAARWSACALAGAGLACLAWVWLDAAQAADERRQLHAAFEGTRAAALAGVDEPAPALFAPGLPVGRLTIPRLGVSELVIEGDHEAALKMGVGHLSDTPQPWEGGNTALAGHRDTFFRPLRHIAVGDRISFATPHGMFDYRVAETLVVDPEDVWVLNPTATPTLTLITCYPFSFVGPAPRRFIVRAHRVKG